MFDQTFFRFALGFAAIIALSVGLLYVAERFENPGVSSPAQATLSQ